MHDLAVKGSMSRRAHLTKREEAVRSHLQQVGLPLQEPPQHLLPREACNNAFWQRGNHSPVVGPMVSPLLVTPVP